MRCSTGTHEVLSFHDGATTTLCGALVEDGEDDEDDKVSIPYSAIVVNDNVRVVQYRAGSKNSVVLYGPPVSWGPHLLRISACVCPSHAHACA